MYEHKLVCPMIQTQVVVGGEVKVEGVVVVVKGKMVVKVVAVVEGGSGISGLNGVGWW